MASTRRSSPRWPAPERAAGWQGSSQSYFCSRTVFIGVVYGHVDPMAVNRPWPLSRPSRRFTGLLASAALLVWLSVAPAAEATFPGKPGRIAYSAELPGQDQSNPNAPPPGATVNRGFDIFTANPDGSDLRRLTENATEPNDEREPAWSPDGTLIALSAIFPFRPEPHTNLTPMSRIDLMAPDGSGRRTIAGPREANPDAPAFALDGSRVFYTWTISDLLSRGVASVDLNGANRRLEDPRLFDNYGSHVSPDGRLKVSDGTAGEIVISRLDGSKSRNLTNTPGVFEFDPAFAPDMSAVVFTAQDPSDLTPPIASVITVIDLDTGDRRVVSPVLNDATNPDWGAIPVDCGGRRATQVGTEGKDRLVGTKGRDVIAGLGGRDKIKGKGGKDILCGGEGKDRLSGNKGRDKLLGGRGKDLLSGGKGRKDRCVGGPGRDRAKACERTKKI
jgi:hypothetical protein